MAKKTQLRSYSPFTGKRYGSFFGRESGPDFMHGTLKIMNTVGGDIQIVATMLSRIRVVPNLLGRVDINK